jgi:alkanesulfonate monooxygenase SsuD/methylene tetrahydromethanopterin reductase-like flavin-dependent oxidoreductase (luciferase family)
MITSSKVWLARRSGRIFTERAAFDGRGVLRHVRLLPHAAVQGEVQQTLFEACTADPCFHGGRALTERTEMQFGYFTLSDNHYVDNRRNANQLIADILDEAVYADALGMHSAWIGEHHFSTLGVLSCPDLVLAQVAAKTTRIRLAPAVTVLPLHQPIRVAEQWATLDLLSGGRVDFAAGRGYDRREYAPFHVSFEDNQAIFEEGMEVVRLLWANDGPVSHHGRRYQFDDVAITPRPVQRPIPVYVASFSRPSIELAARLGCNLIVAPFAAAMTFGGLHQVRDLYHDTCARHGKRPGRLMCSYFLHLADTPAEEAAARARQVRYYKECVIAAFPGNLATAPPSYRYFIEIVDRLHKVQPQDLNENAVLLGRPAQIIDTLKKAEAAGIDEVILYANVGLKEHGQVKEEMARFMAEVAPAFR